MALLSLFMFSCLAWGLVPAMSDFVGMRVYAAAAIMGVLEAMLVRRRNAAIRAERDPTRCRECGYMLRGLVEARCPECGTAFDPELLKRVEAD